MSRSVARITRAVLLSFALAAAFAAAAFLSALFALATASASAALSSLFALLLAALSAATAAFAFLAGARAVALILGTGFQFLFILDHEDTLVFDGGLGGFQGGLGGGRRGR